MSYLYAQGTCKGFNGDDYTISIIHNAAGTDLTTTFSLDGDGFVLTYESEDDQYLVPGIVHSRCTITTIWQPDEFTALNTMLSDLVDSEDGDFFLRVDRDSTLVWCGVLLIEQFRITEDSALRDLKLVASDAISLLKNVDYNNAGTEYTGYQTVYQLLQNLQEKTTTWSYLNSVLSAHVRLAWAEDVVSIDDYTYTTHPPGTQFGGITRSRIGTSVWRRYEELGIKYVNCYEVLQSLCNTYQWRMYAYSGAWWFIPIRLQSELVYGKYLYFNGSTGDSYISGSWSYQTSARQKLTNWTIGYSPTAQVVRINRSTNQSASIIRAFNFDDGTTLSDNGITYEGQDTASDTEFIRLSGKVYTENSAIAGLTNNERVARIVLRLLIQWDDGADVEYYSNTLVTVNNGAVVTWLIETLGLNAQNDMTPVVMYNETSGSTLAYFFYHIETEEFLYDAGVDGERYTTFTVDIPLPTTSKTALSITPEVRIHNRDGVYDSTLNAAVTATWSSFAVNSWASDDELRLLSDFDIIAETTTGKGEIDLGTTYIGGLSSAHGRIGVEVSSGVFGSSEEWVNQVDARARPINKLLVEEVLALNRKPAFIERGTITVQSGSYGLPIVRFYDDDTGRYYTPMTWELNAGQGLIDVTLRSIGRNFDYITSDEGNPTRNPFLDDAPPQPSVKPGNVSVGYNLECEDIFNAWTSGAVIGSGKTLEAYYSTVLNGQGRYVEHQGDTPSAGTTIERVIYVKSDGLATHSPSSGWTSPAGLQPTPANASVGPTLKECWAAINGYLSKFSGSQNNFSFVISYEEVSAFTGILDSYPGAAAAYSLRKLDKDYTGYAIKVRESAGNTLADIGFDSNGDLDTTALLNHTGVASGYVHTWYDQSGNGNNAVQSTNANQPQIVSSGSVINENGLPAIKFDGSNDYFTKAFTLTNPVSHFVVAQVANINDFIIDGYGNANRNSLVSPSTNNMRLYNGAGIIQPYTAGNQSLFSSIVNSANSSLAVNGSNNTGTLGTNTMDGVTIGAAGNVSLYLDGTIQEVILYGSDESSNRTGIESNINTYYTIY